MNPQQNSIIQTPADSLLNECRDIARARLAEVVAGALAKIDEDLFQLADKSVKRDEQQMYLDAMSRVRQHRTEIQRQFEESFKSIYDKRLDSGKPSATPAAAAPASDFGGIELSLVSDSIIETGIAIDRLAKTVMTSLDNNEMLGIRARFGMLLNRDSLEDADNPLSPEAIFEALKLACNHVPAEDAVKQAMLAAFQPYLSKSISQIYRAVNESLVAHHILPRIRHTVKTTADPMGVSQRMMGMSATQRMKALSQSGRLSQFDGTAPAERSGWLGDSLGNEQAGIASLLAGLAQGQASARAESMRMLADPARFSAGDSVGSESLLEALARLQSEANLGSAAGFLAPGFLRDMDRGLVAQGTPLDQLTIELVTVVFDYLHNDPKIDNAIKGLIARLQIVAVKAAILDRSFFAQRLHPMRRLLDRMAEAGADPTINRIEDGPFMRGIKHVVDDLAVQFKQDVAVFATAFEELEALVAREHAAADSAAAAQAHALAAQEAVAAAEAAVRADLAGRITAGTPDFIRDFLTTLWLGAVVDAHVRGLAGDDSVPARLSLAADLIWSVEPKGRADIPALAGMLPKLVRGLMRGLAAVGGAEAERQAFFNQLMQAHTGAIAAAKAATADVVSQPVPSQSPAAPVLKSVPMFSANDDYECLVLEMSRGALVEFFDGKVKQCYKLTWVSPKRTFYLFTNGGDLRQMNVSTLAGLFRQGVAVRVDGTAAVVDRAIDALSVDPAPVALAA